MFGTVRNLWDQSFRVGMARNISLTMISFVILAASGVLVNVFVVAARDSSALGVFNQAYSVYIIVSQFAVAGIHYSVMRNAAFHENSRVELGRILSSAVLPSVILGVLFALAVVLAEPWFSRAFDSAATGRAISNVALGMIFFPVNKVLISFINGLRHMAAFAALQALRYIIVAIVAIGVAYSSLPFEDALYCFIIAEFVTLLVACAYIARRRLCVLRLPDMHWIKRHFVFGGKSMAAGLFGEINTRIDVLMLGLFLPDADVGVYSFAAFILDGLFHLLAMIRVNFNPYLVSALRDKQQDELHALLRKTRLRVPIAMGVLSLLAIAAFYVACTQILPGRNLMDGMPSLIILLAAMVAVSGFVPYDNLMLASGHPGYQTLQQMAAVLANVAGNLLLIPIFHIAGAALGTACGFVLGTLMLIVMSKRMLGWDLLSA
jgi:O-antigen/teichoic acid export membrane protein